MPLFYRLITSAFRQVEPGAGPVGFWRICYHGRLLHCGICPAIVMPARTLCSRFLAFAVFVAIALSSLSSSAKEASLRRWPDKVAAPALQLNDLEGRAWNAASLRGKVVVLNFWASWCAPCIDEMAYLNELASSEPMKDKLVV